MKNMLIGFTITAAFVTAVYFGANGEFWNAAGWSLLTFAIIMLVIQHENHKAELAKRETFLNITREHRNTLHRVLTEEIARLKNTIVSREEYAAALKIAMDEKIAVRDEAMLCKTKVFDELRSKLKNTTEALPTAEELEDPELLEFYSLVIEEIKHQNL